MLKNKVKRDEDTLFRITKKFNIIINCYSSVIDSRDPEKIEKFISTSVNNLSNEIDEIYHLSELNSWENILEKVKYIYAALQVYKSNFYRNQPSKWDKCLIMLENVRRHYSNFEVENELIFLYFAIKEYDKVIELTNGIVESRRYSDEQLESLLYDRGMAYKALGDLNKASSNVVQSIKCNNSNIIRYYSLIEIKLNQLKFDEVDKIFKKLSNCDKDDFLYKHLMLQKFSLNNQYIEFEKLFAGLSRDDQRIILMHSQDLNRRYGRRNKWILGVMLMQQGVNYIQIVPRVEKIYIDLYYKKIKNSADFLKKIEDIRHESHLIVMQCKLEGLIILKEYAQAISYSESHMNIFSQHPYLMQILGNAYLAVGDLEAAYKCFKPIYNLHPIFLNLKLSLGNYYFQRNEYEQALEYYDAATQLETLEYYKLLSNKAICHIKLGHYEKAENALQMALKFEKEQRKDKILLTTGKNQAQLLFNLIKLYISQEEHQKAEEQIAELLKLNANDLTIEQLKFISKHQKTQKQEQEAQAIIEECSEITQNLRDLSLKKKQDQEEIKIYPVELPFAKIIEEAEEYPWGKEQPALTQVRPVNGKLGKVYYHIDDDHIDGRLDARHLKKMKKAAEKGVVGPEGESGIKEYVDAHSGEKVIELKIKGKNGANDIRALATEMVGENGKTLWDFKGVNRKHIRGH